MPLEVKEFEAMKKKIEDLRRQSDKAQGAFEQTMETLKKDFGCETIEVAKEKTDELREKAVKLKARYEKSEKEFLKKWGSLLKGSFGE